MRDGIVVRIIGDSGPFSRMGKSIGYIVEIGRSTFLIDCGAPLFQQIGGEGLRQIDGLIITHCHEDHKRWFSDLALFNRYAPDGRGKVPLITSESVHEDVITASMPALGRSLSLDSKSIVDLAYEDFVRFRLIGPAAKYAIAAVNEGGGRTGLCVVDRSGARVGPERAKIVISGKTMRPRLLFRDPEYGEWIEPESFYTFSSADFYGEDPHVLRGEGFTIEAIKAPVWHGVTGVGLKISTGAETLVFSSDTANDRELWQQLRDEKRVQRLGMSEKDFLEAGVLYGDINDYIERVWSEERLREAYSAFESAVVLHDISTNNSVVHTDYEKLHNTMLRKELSILTHSPDCMTSEWVLSNVGKSFLIRGERFLEIASNRLYPMNADVYHKEAGKYYAGYINAGGLYAVHEKDGLLRIGRHQEPADGLALYRVDLYEDINGMYFPKIESDSAVYLKRKDGRVELLEFGETGSLGRVVDNQRDRLSTPDGD